MNNSLPFATFAVLTLASSSAHATPTNLLVNGDFSAGNTKVPAGWTAVNNHYEHVQNGSTYYMGNGQGDGTTYLSQSFSDITGSSYELTFTVYVDNGDDNLFSASVDGNSLFSGTDLPQNVYTKTESFVGTGYDTLQFGSYAAGANYLSAVSVTLAPAITPEPNSIALLGTGLIGIYAIARRRLIGSLNFRMDSPPRRP